MLFTEPAFLFLLLPVLCGLYYVLPLKAKNWWLLLGSLFFYWWGEKLFVLMVISIALNYGFGLLVDRQRFPVWAKRFLILGVAANLLLLGVYKYANFVIENVNALLAGMDIGPLGMEPDIHLPIGISFFTFQAVSYIVDVYRGESEKQKNPLDVGLYIALFPQLIMGPIVRYKDVAAQIIDRHISRADVAGGLRRFIKGLAKKTLVANAVAPAAEICFGASPDSLMATTAWLGITCYIIQLYFDFSGYSDMAIGLGRMFGFTFPENFDHPYISRSITEMWRRWHITLSTFFRDYVYIPLGGNRVPSWRISFNLLTIFVLCGLWHGANWTFLLWGLWNGVFLITERVGWLNVLKRLPAPVSWSYTMLSWMLGLVLFNSPDLAHALAYLGSMFTGTDAADAIAAAEVLDAWSIWGLIVGVIFAFPVLPWLESRYAVARDRSANPAALDIAWQVATTISAVILLVLCIILIAAGAYSPFLYTQF